jgi:hypothetical protein
MLLNMKYAVIRIGDRQAAHDDDGGEGIFNTEQEAKYALRSCKMFDISIALKDEQYADLLGKSDEVIDMVYDALYQESIWQIVPIPMFDTYSQYLNLYYGEST